MCYATRGFVKYFISAVHNFLGIWLAILRVRITKITFVTLYSVFFISKALTWLWIYKQYLIILRNVRSKLLVDLFKLIRTYSRTGLACNWPTRYPQRNSSSFLGQWKKELQKETNTYSVFSVFDNLWRQKFTWIWLVLVLLFWFTFPYLTVNCFSVPFFYLLLLNIKLLV